MEREDQCEGCGEVVPRGLLYRTDDEVELCFKCYQAVPITQAVGEPRAASEPYSARKLYRPLLTAWLKKDVRAHTLPADFRCICGHWRRNHNDTGCIVGIVGPVEKTCGCQEFKCRDLYDSDAECRGEQEPRS